MRSVTLLLLVGVACSKPAAPLTPSQGGRPPGATGSAQISGHVRFHGVAPADVDRPSKLAFPECSRFGPPESSLRLSHEGGVAEAFVWIKAGLPEGSYPAPSEPLLLDQQGCEFRPRVFGIQVGQPLTIRNSDPVLHNTHAFSGGFNVPLPKEGQTATRTFARPEVPAPIGCDVHGWMRAYAGVVPHPFFAVTDDTGAFSLRGLPAGHYEVEVWQERLGRQSAEIDVKTGERAALDIELKPAG